MLAIQGKILNALKNTTEVFKNKDIVRLIQAMGLIYGKTYDASDLSGLRYRHLLIMTDQDTDGSHIKGLLLNLIWTFWPSLLSIDGFVQQFCTPLLKIRDRKKEFHFYSKAEYEEWRAAHSDSLSRNASVKYYKVSTHN